MMRLLVLSLLFVCCSNPNSQDLCERDYNPDDFPPLSVGACNNSTIPSDWKPFGSICITEGGTTWDLNYEVGWLGTGSDRQFYYFQPALESPETKPLIVFYNGGPFVPTAILLAGGTGKSRMIDGGVARPPEANPNTWQDFGNLLYLDALRTGYSDDGAPLSLDEDADFFATNIVRFLLVHESLRNVKVVLAGESYGGQRNLRIADFFESPSAAMVSLWNEKGTSTDTYSDWLAKRLRHSVHIQGGWNEEFVVDGESNTSARGAYILLQENFELFTGVTPPDELGNYISGALSAGGNNDFENYVPSLTPGSYHFLTNAGLDDTITLQPVSQYSGGQDTCGVAQVIVVDYLEAGHDVASWSGEKLKNDVKAWLVETGAMTPAM